MIMNIWHALDPNRVQPLRFDAVVEIPRGGKLKYELDKETGFLLLDRILHTSTHYPANYGFIPLTLAEDGDPLDVLILSDEAFAPYSIIPCHPIGVIRMDDGGACDEKIIAVAEGDPSYKGYQSIRDLPAYIFEEMSHFFSVYKELEGKKTVVKDIEDVERAHSVITASMVRYREVYPRT